MKWSDSEAVIQQSGHKINRIMKPRFRIGATAQFLLAFGHLLCMLDLWRIFEVYGIAESMQGLAALWSPLPYLITAGLVVCFALAGLYALETGSRQSLSTARRSRALRLSRRCRKGRIWPN